MVIKTTDDFSKENKNNKAKYKINKERRNKGFKAKEKWLKEQLTTLK